MTVFSARLRPFALPVLAALMLSSAALSAQASDSKGHDAPAAKEAAKPGKGGKAAPVAEAPAKASPGDPMDALREKLAAKLGATKAPEAATPYVMRVVSKSGEAAHPPAAGHAPAAAAAGHGSAPTAAKVHDGHSARVVSKLRKEKAAHGGGSSGHAAHWSYGGSEGPESWGALKPEFAKCSSGTRQSPIDIRGGVKLDLEPIVFDYQPTNFRVIDNGHTVQVNVSGGNAIEVMGRRYDLVQFHFHRPSEERVDGRLFDMSLHLVHRDPEGRLAVVGVLLQRGGIHPVLQTVWNNLPLEKGEEQAAQVLLDPSHLLPADRRYYTYMGSLTTPPCSEGVLWMVMQQPVPVANDQVAVFSRLYPMNARPVQSAAGRLIKASN